jgi:hypothetical protein
MGRRTERMKRALQVTSVARQRSLLRVLASSAWSASVRPTARAPSSSGARSRSSAANRIGAAMIVVGLPISSALMARVDHTVSLVGFLLSGLLALYLFWRIIRTPGDL